MANHYSSEKSAQYEHMTTAVRIVTSPIIGRRVYDTDLKKLFIGDGINWKQIPDSSDLSTDFLTRNFYANIQNASTCGNGFGYSSLSAGDKLTVNPRQINLDDLSYFRGKTRIEVYAIAATGNYDTNGLPEYKITAGTNRRYWNWIRFYGTWETGVINTEYAFAIRGACTNLLNDYCTVTGIFDSIALVGLCDNDGAGFIAPDAIAVNIDGAASGTISFDKDEALSTHSGTTLFGHDSLNICSASFMQNLNSHNSGAIGTGTDVPDVHTVKFTNVDSGANYNLCIFAFDLICSVGTEVGGKYFIDITEKSINASIGISNPSFADGKGGKAWRYIKTDNTRNWATRSPYYVGTTGIDNGGGVNCINLGANAIKVTSSIGFAIGDIIQIIHPTNDYTNELFYITGVPDGSTINISVAATQAFIIGSLIKHYAKTGSRASHANENYLSRWFTEFGTGYGANYEISGQTNAASANGHYELEDNLTSMAGNDCTSNYATTARKNLLRLSLDDVNAGSARDNYLRINFYGTGIDINYVDELVTDLDLYIDGVKFMDLTLVANNTNKILKLVSDLPRGSHSLEIFMMTTTAGQDFRMMGVNIYDCSVPNKSGETLELIDEGNILAEVSFDATYIMNGHTETANDKPSMFSKGVSNLSPRRELYPNVGNWTMTGSDHTNPFSCRLNATAANDECDLWFYGTGIEITTKNSTNCTAEIRIDGSLATVGNFASLLAKQTASLFSTATGIITLNSGGDVAYKIGLTGLSSAAQWHRLNIKLTANLVFNITALGIIGGGSSPIPNTNSFSYATRGSNLGNVKDLRKIKAYDIVVPQNFAFFKQSGAGSLTGTLTSTNFIIPSGGNFNYSLSLFVEKRCLIKLSANIRVVTDGSNHITCQWLLDCNSVPNIGATITSTGNYHNIVNEDVFMLEAGNHSFIPLFKTSAGTATIHSTYTSISIVKICDLEE